MKTKDDLYQKASRSHQQVLNTIKLIPAPLMPRVDDVSPGVIHLKKATYKESLETIDFMQPFFNHYFIHGEVLILVFVMPAYSVFLPLTDPEYVAKEFLNLECETTTVESTSTEFALTCGKGE